MFFLQSKVWEVDDLFQILEEEIGVNKRKKPSWVSVSLFVSMVVDFISFLTVHSRYCLQRLLHNENNCSLVLLEIWYKYQQRHMMLSQLHFNPKYPFLRMLTKDQEPLLRVQQLEQHQSQPSITIKLK